MITSLLAFLAVASTAAVGLTVSISSPTSGTWTALNTTTVLGTASGATPDRHQLDSDADLGGGQFVNTTNVSGQVRHDISAAETFRYAENFNGLAGSSTLDAHWMWNLTGTLWQVNASSGLSASPPSLAKSGVATQRIYWVALLPGPAVDGALYFRVFCEANATLNVRLSSDGNSTGGISVLNTGVTTQYLYAFGFTTFIAGRDSVYIQFDVGASSAVDSACSIDDFEVVVNYTRASTHVAFFSDDFSAALKTVWNSTEGQWGISSSATVTDTVPAMAHQGAARTSLWANWATVSTILSASVRFHTQCEANGTLQAYVGPDGTNETNFLTLPQGQSHTTALYNATPVLAGKRAIFVRFSAFASSAANSACGVDDFNLTVQLQGHQNLTYTGLYTSPINDLGYVSTLSSVDWASTEPTDTSVVVAFRSSVNNISYSPWQDMASKGAAPTPASGRFVQFRAAFASVGGVQAAVVDWLAVNYSGIAVVEWSVNGVTWYPANGTASWSATIALVAGANNITVRAFDTTGALATATVTVNQDAFPPSAPGKPSGPAVTNSTSATWTWAAATDQGLGVDRYLVNVGLTPGGTELATDQESYVASFTFSGLPDGVRVYASVRAIDLAGLQGAESLPSDPVLVDRTPPGPVTVLGPPMFSNNSTLAWSWQPPADFGSGIASYLVKVGTAPGASNVAMAATANLSFAYSGAQSGTSYFATVSAIDAAGNEGAGSATAGTVVDLAAPSAPQSVVGPPTLTNSTSLMWSWTPAADPISGIARYEVRVGTSPGGADRAIQAWTTTSYSLSSAASGETLHFSVRAVDGAGNFGPLAMAEGVLVDATAPAAPNVTAVPAYVANATLRVVWRAPTDLPAAGASGVAGYIVRLVQDGLTTVINVNNTSTTIGLVDGNRYTVFVAAVDRAGNVGGEASVTFTADLSGPLAPAGLKVVVTDPAGPSFTASWNGSSDLAAGLKEYRISIGTSKGGNDVLDSALVSATSTGYSWTGEYGTEYFVTVWGVDNLGNVGPKSSTDGPVAAKKPGTGGGGLLPGAEAMGALAALASVAAVFGLRSRLRR